MNSQKLNFGDKKVDKREFYLPKKAISLDSVDLNKIVVSSKWKINDTTCKYFCGYLDDNIIPPLCVILPQMNGYIKYFDDGAKNMLFITVDKNIYSKYNDIWNVIKKLLKAKCTIVPIRDEKYLITKLKVFGGINNATFTDDAVPLEKNCYMCIAAIDIDSVLKIDKKVYPRGYLEQCKYKLKKRRPIDFIYFDTFDEEDSDDYLHTTNFDNELNLLI